MEFFETVDKRISVRSFKGKVEDSKIEKILAAIKQAPSAGNLQAFEVIVVRKKKTISELAKTAEQDFIAEASVVLAFFSNPKKSAKYGAKAAFYSLQDATIAAAYSQLACTSLGLASVWIGHIGDISGILKADKNMIPVCMIPIGYPNETPKRKDRRNDIFRNESF